MEQLTIKNNLKNSAVATSVDIRNALCKAAVTHLKSHTTRAPWICSEAENSAIVAKVKMIMTRLQMRC